jgi:adenylate cyclase
MAIDPDDLLTQYNVACVYAKLGDLDPALDLLECMLPRANHETKAWVRHDPDFDALRALPRYERILALLA